MISKGRVIRTGLFFSIINFLITALIGVFLRFNILFPIPGLVERYWIHAHSHTGFLGWIFMILVLLGFEFLLPKNAKINRSVYRLIIYFQVAVLGMLVTFPFMGYAAPSILFSTLHLVLSIVFVKLFFRNADQKNPATKFMRVGLIFMLISSIGPLALGPIIVLDLRDSYWYEMAVYFYLHYNGWFTLAVFALLIYLMEVSGLSLWVRNRKLLYRLLVFSAIMTLALSALGFSDSLPLRLVGMIGALLQLLAGFVLLKLLFLRNDLRLLLPNSWVKWFFGVALFSWLMKIMMQFLSAIPVVTEFAYLSRDAIMTYLHLSFLGFTSCFVIGVLIRQNYLKTDSVMARVGFVAFLVAVVTMELTIGLKSIPQYLDLQLYRSVNTLLLIESIVLFGSIFIMLFFAFILSNRAIKRR